MEITVLHMLNPVPVSILHLQGQLDETADGFLVEEAEKESNAGSLYLLLDLTFVTRLNEAGLANLQKAAAVFNDGISTNTGNGAQGIHRRVKLIHVRPDLQKVFEQAGLNGSFETCTDLRQAVESFR